MAHSKKAVMLAVDSDYGNRLLEIAREHVRLVRETTTPAENLMRHSILPRDDSSALVILARIEQLRKERDEIIQKFEEDGIDAGNITSK